MTRLIALLCLVALAGPGAAMATERDVMIPPGLQFKPKVMNVLVNDTVRWTNKDTQDHDVQSNDPGMPFGSGELKFNGTYVSPAFTTTGDVPYRCARHGIMTGTVRVHELWLAGPSAPVLFGNSVRLNGLAPEGTDVDVERLNNQVWTLHQTVTAGAEDTFSLTVPTEPAKYRAVSVAATTAAVTVAVKPRVTLAKKRLPRKRTRVTVTAAPSSVVGAITVLQRKKPAGWAKIASKRLGTNSKAAFVVRPPKGTWRVRALVKASDGYAAGQSAVIAVKR